MRDTSIQREHLTLILSIAVMALLSLNFTADHTLSKPFELRFIVGGTLYLVLSLYLRFLPYSVTPLYKALYRIAVVMALWAFGLFLYPTPDLILYLIALPAFYFLYRIEVKKNIQPEDLAACGMLLTLAVLAYLQQQPVNILFFGQRLFSWDGYYRNAPLLILAGIGFLRLNKYTKWQGVYPAGMILFMSGIILTGSNYTHVGRYTDPLWAIMVCHLFVGLMHKDNVLLRSFMFFSGIAEKERTAFVTTVWIFALLLMHGCVLYMISLPPGHIAALLFSLAALSLFLYRHRTVTLTLFFAESMLLFAVWGIFLFPEVSHLWMTPSAAILAGGVLIRKTEMWRHTLPNRSLFILWCLYYMQFSGSITLDYWGLLFAFVPVACWAFTPERPFSVPPRHGWLLWPSFIAIVMVFAGHGFTSQDLPLLAVFVLVPPSVIHALMGRHGCRQFVIKHHQRFHTLWQEHGQKAVLYLTFLSMGISVAGFTLNYIWYANHWTGVVQTGIVCFTGIFFFLHMAALEGKTIHIMSAEFLIWAALGLVRWKVDILEILSFGSPLDGYFLITAAVIAAGLREIATKKTPGFGRYFQKSTMVYGIAGWLYLQLLQFLYTDAPVGFNHHDELASLLMAAMNYRFSRTIKKSYLIGAFAFANTAILFFFFQNEWSNLLFYVFPIAFSALILVQLFKESLTPAQVKNLRLIIALAIFGTSAFYNITDFNESIRYPVVAALSAGVGVLIGISLRVRIYLYMGLIFFLVNGAGVVGHIIINQPPENMLVLIALLFLLGGIPLIALFVVLQIKRRQIFERYQRLMTELGTWE